MDCRNYFKGKKITMLGLGLLGRGVNVAKFLAEEGAVLTISDLKTKDQLASSINKLAKYKNITFILGEHRLKDFQKCDMVIKAAGVPLNSPFVKEAKKNKIPVEMDASLFARLVPDGVTIVGITGTRGKSSVTHMLHWVLEQSGRRVFLGGNVRGMATLPLLKKVKEGDIVVMELDSWQLQGFGDAKVSPEVAAVTTFYPDHLNYYKGNIKRYAQDKANIFKYQKGDDICIFGPQAKTTLKKYVTPRTKSILIAEKLPKNWKLKIPGEHNRYNASIARALAATLSVPETKIKKYLAIFPGVPGRLEFVGTKKGIRFYNDTTATTPEGTIAALRALGKKRNIILLAGGADKKLTYKELVKEIGKLVKALVLFRGTATEKITALLPARPKYDVSMVQSMNEALKKVKGCAKKGDIILLSPAAASFGMFKNEFDRGDQFVRQIKKI